jgi:hypothetical protein
VILLPRLPGECVKKIYDDILAHTEIEEIRIQIASIRHDSAQWGATGGRKVEDSWLANTADQVRDIARELGYPDSGNVNTRRKFDVETAQYLHERMQVAPVGELLRKDFWTFVAAVMLPDVSVWRYPDLKIQRLLGGVRNVFWRLWWRAFILDRGSSVDDRWWFLEALTEDFLVQVTERPGISSSPRVARALAESWIRMADTTKSAAIEDVGRAAAKYTTAKNVVILLDSLGDRELHQAIDELFVMAKTSVVSV